MKNNYSFIDFLAETWADDLAKKVKAETKRAEEIDLKTASVRPQITDVIFNAPATIVKWTDGTKTVVKCGKGDQYDKEKGLALAVAKKYYGNISGWYSKKFAQWLEEKGEKQCSECKCKKQKKEADRKVEYVKLDLDDLKALLGLPF